MRTLLVALMLTMAFGARASDDAALMAAMQEGGTVVYLRHAATDESEIDTGRLYDRAGQRNLSATGREQARALGEAFRALGIRWSRILASPVYRAADTAHLAFGEENVEITMDIVADDYAGGALRTMLEATRQLLAETPPPGENLLLVGHRTPLEMVWRQDFPDTVLPEGAMAVFRTGGGETRLLGTLPADALVAAARARD